MTEIQDYVTSVVDNVEKVIIGKRPALELLMVALLCEGHVLLEDVPGVGKTMLARSFAISMGGEFNRVQCTPDLLPNDVTGVSVYNQQSGQFTFRPGPLFANILLVDEINRATPRTQSALLEAMQEQQVTVDGESYPLPRPFLVLATQNPIEFEGTFPLPEAQLDRFLIKLSLGYPAPEDERRLLAHMQREHPIHALSPVVEAAQLPTLQKMIWEVFVDDSLKEYIVNLVTATRSHPDLLLGASPRASLALFKAAQALAAVRGRDHALPDDIQALLEVVFTHRLMVTPEAQLRGRSPASVLRDILEKTPLPLTSSTP